MKKKSQYLQNAGLLKPKLRPGPRPDRTLLELASEILIRVALWGANTKRPRRGLGKRRGQVVPFVVGRAWLRLRLPGRRE